MESVLTFFVCFFVFILTFLLGAAAGYLLAGYKGRSRKAVVSSYEDPEVISPEQIKEERKRLKAQQDAFHMLQNYSAEMAYGLTDEPSRPGG